MHELAIAMDIVDVAEARCGGARRIVKVTVEIGDRAFVVRDALEFCWRAATEGTAAEGAALDIIASAGDALRVHSMEVE